MLSEQDPYYRAEVVPASIEALGSTLRTALALPVDTFGAKGNRTHYYGFHRSRNWILGSPDSSRGAIDYSIQGARGQGGNGNWIAAFDLTPGGAWGSTGNLRAVREITQRVYDAARANDPRLANLREFAGSIEPGKVITFRGQGGALLSPFDSTHLNHVHGSIYRDAAGADHSSIAEVMLGADPRPMGDPMFLATVQGTGIVYLTNGVTARWVSAQELPHLVALHSEGTQPLTYNGQVRTLAYQSLVGDVVGPRPPALGPDEETRAILAAIEAIDVELTPGDRQAIIDAVLNAPHNGLTEADRPLLVDAFRSVFLDAGTPDA
jgi:hypothetical protein